MENVKKNGLLKRKIETNFIERNGIFEMKNCGKPKLFENQNLENYLKIGIWGYSF